MRRQAFDSDLTLLAESTETCDEHSRMTLQTVHFHPDVDSVAAYISNGSLSSPPSVAARHQELPANRLGGDISGNRAIGSMQWNAIDIARGVFAGIRDNVAQFAYQVNLISVPIITNGWFRILNNFAWLSVQRNSINSRATDSRDEQDGPTQSDLVSRARSMQSDTSG